MSNWPIEMLKWIILAPFPVFLTVNIPALILVLITVLKWSKWKVERKLWIFMVCVICACVSIFNCLFIVLRIVL